MHLPQDVLINNELNLFKSGSLHRKITSNKVFWGNSSHVLVYYILRDMDIIFDQLMVK